MLELSDNKDIDTMDFLMAKRIGDTLEKHYPGHLWAIRPQREQGIVTVFNLRLQEMDPLKKQWGFTRKIANLDPSPEGIDRQFMRDAGELLERFKISRGRYKQNEFEGVRRAPDRG